MREILFRGKRIDGEWMSGNLIVDETKTSNVKIMLPFEHAIFGWQTFSVIPETVGQFTGLIDKKGTKIFEGDVVLFYTQLYNVSGKKEIVRIKDGCLLPFYDKAYTDDEQGDWINNDRGFEVIGNIHDNPELAKQ